MFRVQVIDNLPMVINKLEMLSINIESAVAEAVMSAEPEIRNLFNDEYFEDTEIEISSSGDGIDLNIKNLDEDYFYYQNSTGAAYSDLGVRAKEIISSKIKSKFGGSI